MRKFILTMSLSLDGFVAGPNGETDWIFRNLGADSSEWALDTLRHAGAHAMGSRSFEAMAAFWPSSKLPATQLMNDIPKIVFSRSGLKGRRQAQSPPRASADTEKHPSGDQQMITATAAVLQSWAEPTVARGNLTEEVTRLKKTPGGFILVHGGASFARSIVAAGLIDEYRLMIHPVALGQGQPLFSSLPLPLNLSLVSKTLFESGALGLIYRMV